jgi:hypothetical protein
MPSAVPAARPGDSSSVAIDHGQEIRIIVRDQDKSVVFTVVTLSVDGSK